MNPIREAIESAAAKIEAEAGGAGGGGSDGGVARAAPEAAPETAAPEPTSDGEAPGSDVPEAGSRTRDDKGRFAAGKAEEKPKATPPVKPAVKSGTPPPANGAPSQTQQPSPPVVTQTEALKPPQSWKPAAREAFLKAPREVQEEALRREKEISTSLQEMAPLRREAERARAWDQTIGPFMHHIHSEGGSPHQVVQSMLQTAAALRGPNRAQVVAKLVQTYGVDIQQLDAALAGGPMPQGQQAPSSEGFRDPRFDAFMGQLERAHAQKQEALASRARADIDAFREGAKYFSDVEADMAMLMSEAGRRGQKLTLQQAYDRACWASDDIRPILQREAAEAADAAKANTASTQRARLASSSLKSQATGTSGEGPKRTGIRASLEAAEAALSKR